LSGFGLGSGVKWVDEIALGAVEGKGDETDVCKKNKKCINSKIIQFFYKCMFSGARISFSNNTTVTSLY